MDSELRLLTCLRRRWQRRRASGAQDSTWGTDQRRERRILRPAASGIGGAGLRPAQADAAQSCQGERGLVLDVLELDAVRAPRENRVRVRSVDDVGDLDAGLVRTPAPVVRRDDEETQVVEQRTLDLGGIALVQLEERAGHL